MTNKPESKSDAKSESKPDQKSETESKSTVPARAPYTAPAIVPVDVDDRSTIPAEPGPVIGPNDDPENPWPASHPSPGHDLGLLEAGQTNEIPPRGYSGGSSVMGIDTRSDEERRVNRTGTTIEETKEAEQRAEQAGEKAEQQAKERDAEAEKSAKQAAAERDKAAKAK